MECGNILLDFARPLVMGIVNITPDSFFDGGQYTSQRAILDRVAQMLRDGASIIDIGAYSTRPGAEDISVKEELDRILPAVRWIRDEFPRAVLSIDTFRSEIARRVVAECGECIINDISGGTLDEQMYATVGELQVPYVMMHIQGTPQTMQENPVYESVVDEILQFFTSRLPLLNNYGVKHVILDPGFGFGKTLEHNYEIMGQLTTFHQLNRPLLVGVSRKSMVFRLLDIEPEQSLSGTNVLNTIALINGANILRVHDVKEAVETIAILRKLKEHTQSKGSVK